MSGQWTTACLDKLIAFADMTFNLPANPFLPGHWSIPSFHVPASVFLGCGILHYPLCCKPDMLWHYLACESSKRETSSISLP